MNSTVKVCEDGEWNILHFMEDKIITMTATHDQFSIVNMNGGKGMFSDLLSWKYGKLMYFPLFPFTLDRNSIPSVI